MNADQYKRSEHDAKLAFKVLERDGFATFQLCPVPHEFPRLKSVSGGAGVRVSSAKIGGAVGRQKRK